jgi:hypothetical protein
MTAPYTKSEIIERVQHIQQGVHDYVKALSAEKFEQHPDTSWSASGYLMHMILSLKPFIKAINLPKDKLKEMFGESASTSKPYDEVVSMYSKRIDAGIRAEDYQGVTPIAYRFPEGTTDQHAYLVQVWDESNQKFIQTLEQWSETELDQYQIPHPAVGLLTIREMSLFTIYHNTLHWNDIQAVSV